jgi:hypothetical protein
MGSATVAIQKLTHNEANVKVTATGATAATITLNTNLYSATAGDLTGASGSVEIAKVMWCVSPVSGAFVTITRASDVLYLYGTGEFNLNANGMLENDSPLNDITVTFSGAGGGTVFMKLKKTSGYGD